MGTVCIPERELSVMEDKIQRLQKELEDLHSQAHVPPLTEREKEHLRQFIHDACGGTPLQPLREFAADYLSTLFIGQLENWETVRRALAERDTDPVLENGPPSSGS